MANDKYIKNRNQWRKSYPVGVPRRPPVIITETKLGADGNTYTTTLDLNQTIRHRDVYELLGDTNNTIVQMTIFRNTTPTINTIAKTGNNSMKIKPLTSKQMNINPLLMSS